MAYNPRVSIVDYLSSKGQNGSFSSRSKLAQQYGIQGYQGTANQNNQLLNYLQSAQNKPVAAPTAPKPVASKPVPQATKPAIPQLTADNWQQWIRANGSDFSWDAYKQDPTQKINQDYTRMYYNGKVIDTGRGDMINTILQGGGRIIDSNFAELGKDGETFLLKDLQLKAMSGDANAKKFMEALKVQGMTDKNKLWEGVTHDQLEGSYDLRHAYMKDNPYGDYTKWYDEKHYDIFNEWLKEDKPMSDEVLEKYKKITDKWNMDDMTNPFVQQWKQLLEDKEGALAAQDVALNTGLGQQDSQNFQLMQQLQQQMADRGMTGSGIAGDAYMRATMGANQNYQQAYTDAALAKSDINSQYNEAIAGSKINQQNYADAQEAAKAQQEIAQQQVNIDLMKMQTEQDKYLTTSTGYVYLGGKMLMNGGKPITSLEYQKLSETQRHNLATENNTAIKNAQDYSLGQDSNNIKREQIAVDLQTTMSKLKLDYAKLGYNYAKLEANNKIQQEKIKIAADNAQTSAIKGQITGLGKQLDNITKQIAAYQKNGDKPPKALVEQYNSIQNQISALVSGEGF